MSRNLSSLGYLACMHMNAREARCGMAKSAERSGKIVAELAGPVTSTMLATAAGAGVGAGVGALTGDSERGARLGAGAGLALAVLASVGGIFSANHLPVYGKKQMDMVDEADPTLDYLVPGRAVFGDIKRLGHIIDQRTGSHADNPAYQHAFWGVAGDPLYQHQKEY